MLWITYFKPPVMVDRNFDAFGAHPGVGKVEVFHIHENRQTVVLTVLASPNHVFDVDLRQSLVARMRGQTDL